MGGGGGGGLSERGFKIGVSKYLKVVSQNEEENSVFFLYFLTFGTCWTKGR